MPVTNDVLARAQRLDRRATEELLAEVYPAVFRMARALTGREGAARQVIAAVMHSSLRVLPTWRRGIVPENWFYHHTLLTARETVGSIPEPREDLLTPTGDVPPEYLAFISALRKLPAQQREAFILHHGERLNDRLLGVSMDCSTSAASTHLRAATEELDAVTGGRAAALATYLSRTYAHLGPTQEAVLPYVRRRVKSAIWQKRVRRLVRRVVILAVLGVLAYAAWRWRQPIMQWIGNKK